MDITCAKCGEPWDSTLTDMAILERRRFQRGEGCPSCGFGTKCPTCSGTGKVQRLRGALSCCYNGKVVAWRPDRDVPGGYRHDLWYVGHVPHVRTFADVMVLEVLPSHESADGAGCTVTVHEVWAKCPTCGGNGDHLETCSQCHGSGKLDHTADEQEAMRMEAARSHIEASDGDPVSILVERGLL